MTNAEAEPQEGDTEGVAASGDVPSESSCHTEASSSHCDVVLMNGDGNGLNSDTESSGDSSLLRDMCLDAIYSLYAISVSTVQRCTYCTYYSHDTNDKHYVATHGVS